MAGKNLNIKKYAIKSANALNEAERRFRDKKGAYEQEVWAKGTSYTEIAESIIRDRKGGFSTPLTLFVSKHKTTTGAKTLCQMTEKFIEESDIDCDILSIEAGMDDKSLKLKTLVRIYSGELNIRKFFDYVDDDIYAKEIDAKPAEGNLIVPEEIKNFKYTEQQIEKHEEISEIQKDVFDNCSKDRPFLNSIDKYEPIKLPRPEDHMALIYDLKTRDQQIDTVSSYEQFHNVFVEMMRWVTGTERYSYEISLTKNKEAEDEFMRSLKAQLQDKYVNTGILPREDAPAMIDKLYRSLYQLYIVQDLIDDPNITDIKITAPDSIRVRIKGKAYMSNVNFVDLDDYLRFVNMIAIRNNIQLKIPEQTFTDSRDENYILRFSITAAYVNSVPWPYLHIRKISRHKLLSDDLIKAGMFDEKIRDYLLDCGKYSRGVVFAGPPGSGKTVALNWFLEEAYEDSAEILVIQENDELFAYRKGVMFQHVVNYNTSDGVAVSLEDLGQLALVAGANVFIIGEAKGPEICSAITLSNSGCRTAITIHSPSSTETIDKMADLAQRGYSSSYEQAKRMLKSFQTIVYLQDFKVQEISEITGYDEEKHDMKYRYIYRRDKDNG